MAKQLTLVPASSAGGGSMLLLAGVPNICCANAVSGAASSALIDRKTA
jgi:hypothetical protein